ncbi:DUF4836 family protein [Pseudochryseolinea flava]|nr:DUF4836 family protein [Pseudochryseolinea flava]
MQFAKNTRSLRHGLVILSLSALVLVSCSKENRLATHIPKDATGVLAFDVKSLAMKSLDFKELLSVEGVKKVFTDLDDSVSTALRNSGIDYMNKAYIFGKIEGENSGYGAAIVALTDANKFEAFVKKASKDVVITKEGSYSLATIEDKSIIGWSETELIVLVGTNDKEKLMAIANLKKEESLIATSETFKDLEKQTADIAWWMNFEGFQNFIPQTGMPGSNFNLKETFMMATCNFEDGQVVVDTKYQGNDEMLKKFNFIKNNVSNDVAGAMPGKTVIGMAGFGLDMDALYQYLESEHLVEAMGAQAEQMLGLTPKEAFETFSGDIAATVNGVSMKEVKRLNWSTGEEYTAQEPEFDYYALIGIAKKENAVKILEQFVAQGMLTKTDNVYSFQDKVFIVEKGNAIAITGSSALKDFAVSGSGEKLNGELSGLLTSNASSMYVNFTNIPSTFYEGSNASLGEHIGNIAVEEIVATSSAVKDKTSTGKLVVKFKNKSENSLLTITKIAKKYGDMIPTEPTFTEPAMDSTAVTEEPVVAINE